MAYLLLAFLAVFGLAWGYWTSAPLLRRDPAPEALSTLSGVLLKTPRAGCFDRFSKQKKSKDFDASLQTASGPIDMVLPCRDDLDRNGLGKTLTVRYVNGTDLVGRSYQVVWEVRTPAHVYLDFEQRRQGERRERREAAFLTFFGLFLTGAALRMMWHRWSVGA